MSEPASTIAREAKGIQQSLKEALKTRDAWDREVDFQRKNLRRHYLRLLLVHPYAKESKDAETHLWMQTSYTFISAYKQRLAALDNPTNSAPRNQQKQPRQSAVEHRKLLLRFRQFLAEEERFWSQLVVRFRRSFDLDDAQPALVALGILPASNQPDGSNGRDNQGHTVVNGRNHFQFPQEDSSVSLAPKTPAERESRLAILSKALVCLGDIARYRELYHEGGGRPKAGQEESVPPRKISRTKRGGRVVEVMPRARNYDKAQQSYEQARLLVPYEGNPSHQLAILASYKKDIFGSLVHYYRALCVRQPYDTASENLGTVLAKVLAQRSSRLRRQRERPKDMSPRWRVESFKDMVVLLHALWRLSADRMDAISPNHAETVRDDYLSLVSQRELPPDTIFKTVILSQAALWKHRMIIEPVGAHRDGDSEAPSAMDAAAVEKRILIHVLAIHETLLQVGIAQIADAPPEENHLAQRITATFRRTLPALRISSKWLMANFKYVFQVYDSKAQLASDGFNGPSSDRSKDGQIAELGAMVSHFWHTYTQFSTDLRKTFPLERLPRLNATLEEDVDTRGFLPLQKIGDLNDTGSGQNQQTDAVGECSNVAEGQGNPNEEQLMRIADLLEDASIMTELVEMENLATKFSRNQFMMEGSTTLSAIDNDTLTSRHPRSPVARNEPFDAFEWTEPEDDAEIASRTDDDPVDDAFRQALEANLEDDEEVVYPRGNAFPPSSALIPPVLPSSPIRVATMVPSKPVLSPIGTSSRSPTLAQSPYISPIAVSPPTTAEDLLNNVMGVFRQSNDYRSHLHESSPTQSTQTQLLFGSGVPNRLGASIWSPSIDDQSLKFSGAGHSYHSPPKHFSASMSQDYSQSKWLSNSSQNSQSQIPGSFRSASLSSSVNAAASGHHHQRSSSSSISVDQLLGQKPIPYDSLRYSSMPQQPPGSHQFQTPLDAYTGSVTNANRGVGMHGALRDYHGNHFDYNQSPGMGQAFGSAPLSQIWGNTG